MRGGPAVYVGVVERSDHVRQTRQHVIACTCEGCAAEMVIDIKVIRKPPEMVYKMAKRRGWKVDLKHARFTCPAH